MAAPAGPMRLHHWTFGVTPGEGYGIKARSAGLNVQVRQRKGDRIDAACGQLRRANLLPLGRT